MARFLKIIGILLVLLIVAAVAIPFVVPADKMKNEVLAQIEARTGRKVSIDHVSFSLFPTLGLSAEGVTVGNPGWAGSGNLAEIRTLEIGVELLPLLHGEYRLKELTLEQPVITLIKHAGQANWDFSKASPQNANAPKTPATPAAAAKSSTQSPLPDLHLGRIAITDGTVTYKDDVSGKTEIISSLGLTLKAPDLNEKADITFSAVYGGKKADVALTIEKLLSFENGGAVNVTIKASYGALAFTWEGTGAMAHGIPSLAGKMNIPSLNTADLSQKGESAHDHEASAQGGKAAGRPASAANSHWSDAPIALEGLARLNADLSLSVGKLTLPKTTLEDISARVKLAGGVLQLQVGPLKAYGGTVTLSAAANTAGQMSAAFAASGAQAEPLLHDFAGYDRLSGTIDVETKLAAGGHSERALIESLSGTGSVNFKNGKLKGVNLTGLLRNLTGAGSDESSTDFSELSGTYTISRGIVTNNDLKLSSPGLRATGAGTADLPDWQEHFLLKPTLVASAAGQGGKEASGITVPVRVDGPLDHPHYQPDFRSALQENLKDPTQLKQNLKNIKQNLLQGGGLGGLLR